MAAVTTPSDHRLPALTRTATGSASTTPPNTRAYAPPPRPPTPASSTMSSSPSWKSSVLVPSSLKAAGLSLSIKQRTHLIDYVRNKAAPKKPAPATQHHVGGSPPGGGAA